MSYDTLSEFKKEVSTQECTRALTLLAECSAELQREQAPARGRPTSLSWTQLCLGVLTGLLRGFTYQRDLWRLLALCPLGPFAPVLLSDQAIYNRLARAVDPMRRLFVALSQQLRARLLPWGDRRLAPFAKAVLALDESTLEPVARWLPALRHLPDEARELLAGRISALFDLRLQQWARVDLLPEAVRNCKLHARVMIETVPAGSLLLLDAGYLSFELFDELSERGIHWICRYGNRISFKLRHVCYQADGISDLVVSLGAYRSDQARYPVRLVSFAHKGKTYRYLCSVLDPGLLPAGEIARLYARRWDIEMAFRALKDYLGTAELWSAKWSVILVQIWAGLLLAQLMHASQVELARKQGVEPSEVSIALLIRWAPALLSAGEELSEQVSRCGRELGFIRPSARIELSLPVVDLLWVVPPPQEATRPREKVRHARRKCGPRSSPKTG